MNELVRTPASSPPASLFGPLTDPAGGTALTRLRAFIGQPPLRRALPWFAGVSAAGATALLWAAMAPAPQRMLYSELSDGERAQVTSVLDKGNIRYTIDNATGAITVGEDDLYKARMLAASNGAIAAPETGAQMLDKLPMGASRTLEGERLRSARERELELTIMQIDGIEAVRVHLAEAEKSVFVRDNAAPTASVMVRLMRGRRLADSEVMALVNLVASSVPGLLPDAVKVVDQHGRLVSAQKPGDTDRLELQGRTEEKLRQQVSQLLSPMLGDGNFSSEIQVELDMDQVTSARESYDKNGVVRSESQAQSQSAAQASAGGVPGILSNTPPPPTTAQAGAPQGSPAPAPSGSPAVNGETSSTRTYELGREVAVSSAAPGKIKRLSVAVALSAEVMAKAKPADIEQIKQLVSAAVGADPARGDQVAVAVRSFQPVMLMPAPFYETPWFATILRNAVALIAVLLVLLLGVRPLIKALKREPVKAATDSEEGGTQRTLPQPALASVAGQIDPEVLSRQVGLAQRMVQEQPDNAVAALRQMLKQPQGEAAQ